MTESAIKTQRIGNALVITFARPEMRNPLSVSVIEDIERILATAEAEAWIERIIFTGTDNVFASGADLREIAALSSVDAAAFSRRGQSLMQKIDKLPQHSVAAVNGFCFGGALDLALACDTRIATPSAQFAHPGANLGIITGWGGTQRLPRLIGAANALEMFFSARPISAEQALKVGLIDAIADDVVPAALELSH
ncbi:MAG TPA: enoyl-CoA hydratase/isomerase family protein [Pyrinomonadaceae bacterium]|nr:enoyl-CoA hydratase/isomerase family protein [Pyrinomonadaceae bacterium]